MRLVRTLLQNINSQDYPNFEVIVVDSESTDNTVKVAKSLGAKVVHIKDEDFTFGYSLNVGCDAADGEILVFISGHCYPSSTEWLSELVSPYHDPEVGLVYGKQRGNFQTKFSEHEIFKQYFWDSQGLIVSPTVYCNNANNSIRKSLWEKIPFDESLTGLEDIDWSIRVHKLGYYSVYNPNAVITHVHDENWGQIRQRFRREAFAIKKMFPQRSMGIFQAINLFLRSSISDLVKSMTEGKFLLLQIIGYRFNQYFGAYQGFKKRSGVELPDRVEEEWEPRVSVTNDLTLSNRNKKFRKHSLYLLFLFTSLEGLSFYLDVSNQIKFFWIPVVFIWSWITFPIRPKESIDFGDLSTSRIVDN